MRKRWEIKTLGNLTDVITKGTTPTSVGFKFEEDGVNFVKVESITPNGKFIPKKFAHISEAANNALKRSQLKEGDILFSIAGALGRTAIVNKEILPANTNQALSIIRLKEDSSLLKEYVLSVLTSGYALEQVEKFKGGVAQQNLSLAQMKAFQIPIPPLQEQQRIVAILDEAFEAIDQAIANIEKNIVNAQELFQSKLNEIFSQCGEGWEEKKLKEIGIAQTGTTPPTKDSSNYGDYIPFVKPPHFNKDGSIDSGDSMLSESGLRKGRLFQENSILMVCIGATIGKTGFSESKVSSNQQINVLTPSNEYVPKLLYYALISPFVQNQVMETGKSAQATLPIINKSKWEKLKIRIPKDKIEQARIVKRLNKLQENTFEIEGLYVSKLAELNELKKSILQKAFEGELTNKEVEV